MKRIMFVIVCLSALVSTTVTARADYWARTWDWVDSYTSPSPAKQGNVWVGVWGEWPTDGTCIPDMPVLSVAGNNVFMDVYDVYAQEACLPGPSLFDLGDYLSLSPGFYNLYVSQYSNLWPLPALEFDYVRGEEYLTTFAVYYVGDLNADGNVDSLDLIVLDASWGTCTGDPNYDEACDLNGNGCVNVADLLILADDWGKTIY